MEIKKITLAIVALLLVAGCGTAGRAPKPIAGGSRAASSEVPAPDYDTPVDVWLVPVAGFPDEFTLDLISKLKADTGLHVRSSLEAGVSDSLFFSDKRQMVAENALAEFSKIIPSLGKAKPNAVYIFLTPYDINSRDRRFRFLFAQGSHSQRTAIVSIARLKASASGSGEDPAAAKARLYKMVKRQVGEHYYNYGRSSNLSSVMYSPLMGLRDLDMIGTEY